MLNEKGEIAIFSYTDFYRNSGEYSEVESKRNSNIQVEFFGKLSADKDTYRVIKSDLYDYLSNYEGDDIVEVTRKMKELFAGIPEIKLEIKIKSKNGEKNQEVKYKDEIMVSYDFTFKNWNDVISVNNSYIGINLQYKKEGKLIRDKGDVELMNDEFVDIFEKIFELRKLEDIHALDHSKIGKY